MNETRGLNDASPPAEELDRIFTDTLDASAISSNSATMGIKNWLFIPNAPLGATDTAIFQNESFHSNSPDLFDMKQNRHNLEPGESKAYSNILTFGFDANPVSGRQSDLPFLGSQQITTNITDQPCSGLPNFQFSQVYGTIHQSNSETGSSLVMNKIQQPQSRGIAEVPELKTPVNTDSHLEQQSHITLSGGPNYSAATMKYLNRFGGISLSAMHSTVTPTQNSGPNTPNAPVAPRGSTFTNKTGLQGISLAQNESVITPQYDQELMTRAAGISEHLLSDNSDLQNKLDGPSDQIPGKELHRPIAIRFTISDGSSEDPRADLSNPSAEAQTQQPQSRLPALDLPSPLKQTISQQQNLQSLKNTAVRSPICSLADYLQQPLSSAVLGDLNYLVNSQQAQGMSRMPVSPHQAQPNNRVFDVPNTYEEAGNKRDSGTQGFHHDLRSQGLVNNTGRVADAYQTEEMPVIRVSSLIPLQSRLDSNSTRLISRNSTADLFRPTRSVRDMAKLLPTNNSLYTKTGLPLVRQLRDRLKFSCGVSSLFESTLQDWEKDPGVSDVAQELSKTVALLRRRLNTERKQVTNTWDQLLVKIGDLMTSHKEITANLEEAESYSKDVNLGIVDRLLVRRAQVIKEKMGVESRSKKEVELISIDPLIQNDQLQHQHPRNSFVYAKTDQLARRKNRKRLILLHRYRFDEQMSDADEEDEADPRNTINQIEQSIHALKIPENSWAAMLQCCFTPKRMGQAREPLWKLGRAEISGQSKVEGSSSARNSTGIQPLETLIMSSQTAQLKSAHTMSMRHLEYPKIENRVSEGLQEYGHTPPVFQQRTFGESQSSQIRMQSADRLPERTISNRTGSDSKQPFYRSLLSGDLLTTNNRPTASSPPPNIAQKLQFDPPSKKPTLPSSERSPQSTTTSFSRMISGPYVPQHQQQQQHNQPAPVPPAPTSPKHSPSAYHRTSGSGYMPLSFSFSARTSASQPSFMPLPQAHFQQPSATTTQQNNNHNKPETIVIRGRNQHWFTG